MPVMASAQPPAVSRGEDLTAWQLLEHRRAEGDEAILAYQQFVLTCAESPLAVTAWTRLLALEGTSGAWRTAPETRTRIDGVERRWRAHEAALASHRAPRGVAVLLSDEGTVVQAP
jgi:hypothetical protein